MSIKGRLVSVMLTPEKTAGGIYRCKHFLCRSTRHRGDYSASIPIAPIDRCLGDKLPKSAEFTSAPTSGARITSGATFGDRFQAGRNRRSSRACELRAQAELARLLPYLYIQDDMT